MSFDAKGYRRAATQAGVPSEVINKTIADKTGVSGWLSGGRQGIGGLLTSAGNILNLPSYAVGGMLDEFQQKGSGALNPIKNPFGLSGAVSGIKNKKAVFEELPQTLGIDPNSKAGLLVGLGGELLTPGLPIGKLGKIGNIFGKGEDVANVFSKGKKIGTNILPDAGRTLLEKSYKLSSSDINKIAKSIGVTDESQKATKVIDYLENIGMRGSTRSSLDTLNRVVDPLQEKLNSMVRTGKVVNRRSYGDMLMRQADELEKFAEDPNTRGIVRSLREEANVQFTLADQGVPITDTKLRNTTTKSFQSASDNSINNPFESSFNEQVARSGVKTLDMYAPGSASIGKELRGLRTVQDVVGKKANTGLGTQLINAFKPSALGIGVGAAAGYSSGQNPFLTGAMGAVGGSIVSSPQFMNKAGKILSTGIKSPQSLQRVGDVASGIGKSTLVKRIPQSVGRIATQSLNPSSNQKLPKSSEVNIERENTFVGRPYESIYKNKKQTNFSNAISRKLGL